MAIDAIDRDMSSSSVTTVMSDISHNDQEFVFPSSVSQQVFWYMEMLESSLSAFNIPLRFNFEGPIDVQLLQRTLDTIIQRHESLRTHFSQDNDELLQVVAPSLIIPINIIDISDTSEECLQSEADKLGKVEARKTFDLASGPLIRAEILKLRPNWHIFHLTIHHAIFDGMSMTVLTKEIQKIYQAYFDQLPCPLVPLKIQYGDFSVWQKDFLKSPRIQYQLEFWKNNLQGMTELDMPTDFVRPKNKTWKGDIISILLPKDLTDNLKRIAADSGSTLFHLQLAVCSILFSRYTGSYDISFGTPVTGRNSEELEDLIGVFINTIILRNDLSGNPSFKSLLDCVRANTLKALEHQDLPFEYLVRELRPLRDQSRNPLFQINFNHHRSFAKSSEFGGVTLTPIPSKSPGTIFDLHFFIVERKEGWRLSCDFSTELFSRESADRMIGHYKNLLEQISHFPNKNINEYNILTSCEKEKIIYDWSGIITSYPANKTIDQLFVEIAIKYPNKIAITSGKENFTYKQIYSSAIHLANELLDAGLKDNELVVSMAESSAEMICGFLAILMAGGCCVPFDPSNPKNRILHLLRECGAKIGIFTACCDNVFPKEWDGKKIMISITDNFSEFSELNKSCVTSDKSAFLLFTSGSTGEPKGVYIPHRGVTRLVRDQNYIKVFDSDVFLQFAPSTFDASLLEIWGALLNGSELVIAPTGSSLEDISNSIISSKVTILWLTSGLFQVMVDHHIESLKGLRYLIAGGDVLSVKHVNQAFEHLNNTILINGYGPTENTTFTCFHQIRKEDTTKLSIPIGKPIANTKVYLLDQQLQPVPVGIHGELFTGGSGLTTGYHNSPVLNRQKFFDHPDFGMIYQTGDICRWDANGIIEFIGRKDQQVKVRGFRIELGEIENVLLKHVEVTQVKVAVRGDNAEDKRIVAWVTLQDSANSEESDLLEFLSNQLPSFMRPDSIMVISSFPLSKNGKIDISKLPDTLFRDLSKSNLPIVLPSNEIEEKLFGIWSDLLGFSTFGCHDNFFMIGGNSLLALRMFSRIKHEMDCSLPLSSLLQHSSIYSLAKIISPTLVELKNKFLEIGNVVTLSPDPNKSPIFCIHGGDGGVLFYRDLAIAMDNSIPIHAIESLEIGFSEAVKVASIRETALAYLKHIRKIQPKGPYRLGGYSFGGIVAFDLACIISQEGEKVEFLGLFDTYNPTAPKRNYNLCERFIVFWRQSLSDSLINRMHSVCIRFFQGIQNNRRIKAELIAAKNFGPAKAFSDLRRVQVREENWRAMQAYEPPTFPGRITLFKTTTISDKVKRPDDYGWTCQAKNGVDIIKVDGEHLTIFSPDNIKSLSHELKKSISMLS